MYLWIDPWIRKLWYWLIDEEKNIILSWILLAEDKSPTRNDQFARMVDVYHFFQNMIDDYPIQWVWIEKLFFTTRNQSNAEFVYGVRWIIAMLFRSKTIPIYEWTPQEIKKYITWNGRASKELMLAVVQKMFRVKEIERHDTADALWIALMTKNKMKM